MAFEIGFTNGPIVREAANDRRGWEYYDVGICVQCNKDRRQQRNKAGWCNGCYQREFDRLHREQ